MEEVFIKPLNGELMQGLALPIFEAVGLNPRIEKVDGLPGTPVYTDKYQVIVDLDARD